MRFQTLNTLALLFCMLVAPLLACSAPLADDVLFVSGKSALAIPFELEDNLIYVPVSINGSKPLSFIFDTGAYTVVDLDRARELGVELQHKGETSGLGDEQQEVFLAKTKVSFSLPGVTLSNQRLLAVPLQKVEACVNKFVVDANGREVSTSSPSSTGKHRKVDGILGDEFFSKFVVEIDYTARLINLYEPRSFKYTGHGEKLPLEKRPQHIFARATIFTAERKPLTGTFLIDTGAAMAVALSKQFTDEHQLLPPREQLSSVPACGLAGETKIQSLLGGIEALQLGNTKIPTPLVEFRRASGEYDFDGFIGGAIFRKYKVIFDYSRRVMILE
jgi:aspartyl protease